MIKLFIYYSSYFFVALALAHLCFQRKYHAVDALFVIGVLLVPIGKLFYLPIPGMVSVKAAFIYTGVIGSVILLIRLIEGIPRAVLFPILFTVPILLSVVFLDRAMQGVFLSSGGGNNGTAFLRLISIFLSTIYCCYVIDHIRASETGYHDVARYYVIATLFATAIGALIFYGLFIGQLSMADVTPISVGRPHVIGGKIFRFNPGANVNEFGEIIGYALLMLRWTQWRTSIKTLAALVLLFAEFLGLTRGAWVGLFAAYLVYTLFTEGRLRKRMLTAAAFAIAVVVIIALSWSDFRQLLLSRMQLSAGAGGHERIRSVTAAIGVITSSMLRLLFGAGWAADVYSNRFGLADVGQIHDVPTMILFNTGIVGTSIYIVLLYLVFRFVYQNSNENRGILLSILTFMITVSLFEHNFFHVQTWLMLGVVIGMAQRSAYQSQSPLRIGSQPPEAVHG